MAHGQPNFPCRQSFDPHVTLCSFNGQAGQGNDCGVWRLVSFYPLERRWKLGGIGAPEALEPLSCRLDDFRSVLGGEILDVGNRVNVSTALSALRLGQPSVEIPESIESRISVLRRHIGQLARVGPKFLSEFGPAFFDLALLSISLLS